MGQVVTIGLEFIPFFFLIFLSPLIFLLLEYHLLFLSWSNATLSLTLYYYNYVFTLITPKHFAYTFIKTLSQTITATVCLVCRFHSSSE